MNKKLTIYPLFLFFSIGVVFCSEESLKEKESKMEVEPSLRGKSSKRLRPREEEEEIGKAKKVHLSSLNLSQGGANDRLVQAVRYGRWHEIKGLIEANANLDVRDEEGFSLLSIAKSRSCFGHFSKGNGYNKEDHLKDLENYPLIVEELLKAGVDLNTQAKTGASQLSESWFDHYGYQFNDDYRYSREAHFKSLKVDFQVGCMFLENGVSPDLKNENEGLGALHFAVYDFYGKFFHSSRHYNEDFHLKYLKICFDRMKKLLEHSADPNIKVNKTGKTPLHLLADDSYWELFSGKPNLNFEFHTKYLGKMTDMAEFLLAENADPNIQDFLSNTPLHLNLKNGIIDVHMTKKLLKYNSNLMLRDQDGLMPVHLAAANGVSTYIVALLLQHGAVLSVKTPSGDTALSLTKNLEIQGKLCLIKKRGIEEKKLILSCLVLDVLRVKELIAGGIDLNQKDNEGWTSLMHAVQLFSNSAHKESVFAIIKELLEAGADPEIETNDGTIVLEEAEDNEVKKLIRTYNLARKREKVFKILKNFLTNEIGLLELILELTGTYEPIQ